MLQSVGIAGDAGAGEVVKSAIGVSVAASMAVVISAIVRCAILPPVPHFILAATSPAQYIFASPN